MPEHNPLASDIKTILITTRLISKLRDCHRQIDCVLRNIWPFHHLFFDRFQSKLLAYPELIIRGFGIKIAQLAKTLAQCYGHVLTNIQRDNNIIQIHQRDVQSGGQHRCHHIRCCAIYARTKHIEKQLILNAAFFQQIKLETG